MYILCFLFLLSLLICMEKGTWVSKYRFALLPSIIFVPCGPYLKCRQTASHVLLHIVKEQKLNRVSGVNVKIGLALFNDS